MKNNLTALGSNPPNRFEYITALLAGYLASTLAIVMTHYFYLEWTTSVNSLALKSLIFFVVLTTFSLIAIVLIRITLRIDNSHPQILIPTIPLKLPALAISLYIFFTLAWPLITTCFFPDYTPDRHISPPATTWFFISTILLAPVVEEFVFRRLLYNFFALYNLSLLAHVAIVSSLFSFLHLGAVYGLDTYSVFYWMVYFFVCGSCFHLIRFYTDKLYIAIFAHAIHNALVLMIF